MFKHKPPVDKYESKGVFSNMFSVTHNRKTVCLMVKTNISVLWAGPRNSINLQHKCFVDTDIVRFCNLMHQKSDKIISIRQIRGRWAVLLHCMLKMFQTLQLTMFLHQNLNVI